jgi:hypothetical protein
VRQLVVCMVGGMMDGPHCSSDDGLLCYCERM